MYVHAICPQTHPHTNTEASHRYNVSHPSMDILYCYCVELSSNTDAKPKIFLKTQKSQDFCFLGFKTKWSQPPFPSPSGSALLQSYTKHGSRKLAGFFLKENILRLLDQLYSLQQFNNNLNKQHNRKEKKMLRNKSSAFIFNIYKNQKYT